MVVSNFEVSVKPSLGNVQHQTSYQLQITNLEDKEIAFLVETHVAKSQDGTPPLDLLSPRLLYNPSTYSALTRAWYGVGPEWIDAQSFTLGARLSTILELSPRWLLADESKDQTLIGHVVLRVPPIRQKERFAVTVQSAGPVHVLLSASRIDKRDTFLNYVRDLDGVTIGKEAGNDIFSSQSIEISTGKAANEIEPEGLSFKDIVEAVAALQPGRRKPFPAGALFLPESERIPVLVDLLAALSQNEDDLRALNDLLTEASAAVRVQSA
jgi:hypothetical protein